MTAWIYFGCGQEAGHFLHDEKGRQTMVARELNRRLQMFDGMLAPRTADGGEATLYAASFSRLGGYGLSALSWWDRSVDSRPASNSIIFAPTLTISADEMLAEAQRRFPWVFLRTPQPVALISQGDQ